MTAPPAEPPLVVVVGPTAAGKTEFAVRLAEALDGEIIGADSVQVYRHFDVGTGKPTAAERARAPHHAIDVADPLDVFDAARWAALAEGAIADIRGRGKRPILSGGTFLWIRALLFGLAPAPPANEAVRARHRDKVRTHGRASLHAELEAADPEAAMRLAPNDFVRVSRALEVYELTGRPMSAWHAEHGFRQARHAARLIGVWRDRAELDRRIAARTRAMLDAGWLDEVRRLIALGYADTRPMGSVGYRQLRAALGRETLDVSALTDEVVRATRVFARRQRTWLRDQPVEWVDATDVARVAASAI